jgi:3-oxoacyl-[acyl-carrier protein] reductase
VSLLLEGKRAFVTGGTRGIGAAICEIFAREGADVAFSYNSREDLAAEMSQKIEAHGRKAFNAKVSVVDRVGMKKLTRELVEKWGGIDILVNNAAINRGDNFATTTDRAWDEVIHTNVDSLFAAAERNDTQHHLDRRDARLADRRSLRDIEGSDDRVHEMPVA